MQLKVHRGLAISIMENKKSIINAIATFYVLKNKYVSGHIHNFKKQKGELAEYVGVSIKTFTKHINKLIEHKFIFENSDGSIFLISYKNLKDRMKFYNLCKYPSGRISDRKPTKLSITSSKDAKEKIYYLAIKDKLFLSEVAKQISNNIESGSKNKVSGYSSSDDFTRSNYIGRLGYSRAINCKFKSSGQYWIKKLVTKKLIVDTKNNSVVINDSMTIADYRNYKEKNNFKFATYRNLFTGKVHQLRPNTIEFLR